MKSVTITLYVSELLYDVRNKTHLTGRSRGDANDPSFSANMRASEDDDDQIRRSMQHAVATLKTTLSEYLESEGQLSDNILDDTSTEWNFTLKVPSNYNLATSETLSSAIHQYVVNIAIADWFTITNKADAADYAKLSNDNLTVINEAINKRVRPVRTAPVKDNA